MKIIKIMICMCFILMLSACNNTRGKSSVEIGYEDITTNTTEAITEVIEVIESNKEVKMSDDITIEEDVSAIEKDVVEYVVDISGYDKNFVDIYEKYFTKECGSLTSGYLENGAKIEFRTSNDRPQMFIVDKQVCDKYNFEDVYQRFMADPNIEESFSDGQSGGNPVCYAVIYYDNGDSGKGISLQLQDSGWAISIKINEDGTLSDPSKTRGTFDERMSIQFDEDEKAAQKMIRNRLAELKAKEANTKDKENSKRISDSQHID